MSYVTTNIRLPKEDYLRLKTEAASKRKSFSAIARERLSISREIKSKQEVKKILKNLNKHASENAKYLKGVDGVKIIREMRDQAKW